jgi:hypothetical protein
LAVCGLVGLIIGVLQMMKGKKMGTVPFKKPSEIAQGGMQAGDAKQMVSTEGQVQPGPQPLVAPMSGQQCLAYEITVERKWEKFERTENGEQKRTGSDNIHRESRGTTFQITDGAGAVFVDSSGTIDADMDKSHSSTISVGMMIPGTLAFGQMQMNTPHIHGEARTTAFVGTEKIVKISPNVYALGQLQQGSAGVMIATPKGIGTGKLILSAKGRDALMGTTKRNMILGYAIGGALFVGGTLMGIFGPAPTVAPGQAACESALTDAVACSGRLYSAEGQTFTWTVPANATYSVSVKQPPVKYPIYGDLTITDASGKAMGHDVAQSKGDTAKVTTAFPAGTYKIVVKDRDGGIEFKDLKGGFGYQLVIEKQGGGAAAPSGAAAAGTGAAATKPATTGAAPATAKPATTGAAPAAPSGKPAAAPPKKK